MPLWNKSGTKPLWLTREQKRNVAATDGGWVKRTEIQKQDGTYRIKEEIISTIPQLGSLSSMGSADIDDVWFGSSANVTVGSTVNTWISFNEPITNQTALKMNIQLVEQTSNVSAITANTRVYGSNKLLFRWTVPGVGTYKILAQTVANATSLAANTRSQNSGKETVSYVISSSVANTATTLSIISSGSSNNNNFALTFMTFF